MCVYVCMYICVCMYMCVCVCVCVSVCMYVCMYVRKVGLYFETSFLLRCEDRQGIPVLTTSTCVGGT